MMTTIMKIIERKKPMKEKNTELTILIDDLNRAGESAYIDGTRYVIGNIETSDIDAAIAYASELLFRKGIV